MSRPRNPDSYWNQLDGRPGTPPAHVIEDIRMRRDECWVRCTCGWATDALAPADGIIYKHGPDGAEEAVRLAPRTGLAERYEDHITAMKRQPLLAAGGI